MSTSCVVGGDNLHRDHDWSCCQNVRLRHRHHDNYIHRRQQYHRHSVHWQSVAVHRTYIARAWCLCTPRMDRWCAPRLLLRRRKPKETGMAIDGD